MVAFRARFPQRVAGDQIEMSESYAVVVLMGSKSDWDVMSHCVSTLESLGISHVARVMSAHRTPDLVHEFVMGSVASGTQVFIAAAGGAAHLAGVVASHTTRPVLGVPMQGWSLDGLDSLLSTVQMPRGIPVGTVAIGKAGAINAAILAGQILGLNDETIANAVTDHRAKQRDQIMATTLD